MTTAALQQTPFSTTTTTRATSTSTTRPIQNSLNLSFSRTLPTLTLRRHVTNHSNSGAKMNATAASTYAAALADVATSNNTLEKTISEVEKIERFFSDPQMNEFFSSPIISIERKREVLDEIASSSRLSTHMANFLNVLVDAKRIDQITEIVKEFELVCNRMTDTEVAVVTSVVKLEAQHLAQIAKGVQKLTGAKNVRIKTVIDPTLVAGFTIRYGSSGSKLVDMSVKKQLEEIATQLDLGDIQLANAAAAV